MAHATVYEVEVKFAVPDPAVVERRLAGLGGTLSAVVDQVDRYFAHPARDFAATDEALRLRRVGDDVVVTWKGPRIDATTKTRREIELPVAPAGPPDGTATIARWTDLLEALGFRRVREVAKRRRTATMHRDGATIEAVLDDVAGLGWFLELEEQATADRIDQARTRLGTLARELGCVSPERRSYLELLLAAAGQGAPGPPNTPPGRA
ncbi:MAG: class IV adenylate cyclase [Planctomycetaceae bacterium]